MTFVVDDLRALMRTLPQSDDDVLAAVVAATAVADENSDAASDDVLAFDYKSSHVPDVRAPAAPLLPAALKRAFNSIIETVQASHFCPRFAPVLNCATVFRAFCFCFFFVYRVCRPTLTSRCSNAPHGT